MSDLAGKPKGLHFHIRPYHIVNGKPQWLTVTTTDIEERMLELVKTHSTFWSGHVAVDACRNKACKID